MKRAIDKKRKQILKLFNGLTLMQQEAINIMAMAEFDLLPKQQRSNPKSLIRRSIEMYLVKDYYNNVIEFLNIRKFNNVA